MIKIILRHCVNKKVNENEKVNGEVIQKNTYQLRSVLCNSRWGKIMDIYLKICLFELCC